MTAPLLLDTDVLVDFLRGHDKAVSYVKEQAERVVLSTIVLAQLYAGVKTDEELAKLDRFASLFPVADVTRGLARQGGLYKRDYHRTHGVGLADAIAAATAESEGAELATLNTRHYPMFKGLKPTYAKR